MQGISQAYNDKAGAGGRALLRPMVKLVANMHGYHFYTYRFEQYNKYEYLGNEAVGRELLMALARHLLTNYKTDPRVATILNTTDIHILPTLNPDGFEKSLEGKSTFKSEGNHEIYSLQEIVEKQHHNKLVEVIPTMLTSTETSLT